MNSEDLAQAYSMQQEANNKYYEERFGKIEPMKYYLLTYNQEYNQVDVIGIDCIDAIAYNRWLKAKVDIENIKAYIGNNADGFEEEFVGYSTMKDLVNDGTVTSYEVSKEFHDIFHATDLKRLNNCNLFEL